MYPKNNRPPSGRVNDEFLRRMVGGELIGDTLPVMQMTRKEATNQTRSTIPNCNQDDDETALSECPVMLGAPSLAMVYSPRQCWRNLLEPDAALSSGSLFAELVLPFEGARKSMGTGGKLCK